MAKTLAGYCPENKSLQVKALSVPSNIEELFVLEKFSDDPMVAKIQKLYLALTGTPGRLEDPRLQRALQLYKNGDRMGAVKLITKDDNFLQIRMRNFAAPLSSRTFSVLEPFNDLQALIIGITRDELDARLILTGDLRYSGEGLGLPEVSRDNNAHYSEFDGRGFSYARDLKRVDKQWKDLGVAAGALTTYTWAKNNYGSGTNRRSLQYSFWTFLCSPIEGLKTRALPDLYVRRDVDRAPSKDGANYLNHCRNCHAPMDAMAGAFAYMDLVDGQLTYSPFVVASKMNRNEQNYPAGFITVDDSWVTLLTPSVGAEFGWRTKLSGSGVAEFADLLAHSETFSQCMAKRVFKEICGKDLDLRSELTKSLAKEFEANNFNLKYLFQYTANQSTCFASEIQ